MRGKVVISWIFVIIWMGVIFMFSSMNGEESTDLSDSGIRDVVTSAVSITNKMGITHDDGNQKYFIEKMVIYLNYPVRKCAHMFEYFVLVIASSGVPQISVLRVLTSQKTRIFLSSAIISISHNFENRLFISKIL